MKYRAKCTYCITQMRNIYPDNRKNPMPKDVKDTYIEVDTETEFDCIEAINSHMQQAHRFYKELETYIETELL